MLAFWLLVALGIAVGVLVYSNERDLERRVRERRSRVDLADPPRVAVIVSLEGAHPELRESLDSLAALDYPNHELILVVSTAAALPHGTLPSPAKVIFTGPAPNGMSQQIHNVLNAVQAAGKLVAVLAFVEPGAQVGPAWLRAMMRPLREEGAMAVAGARWLLPGRPGFWTRVHNLWSAGVASTDAGFAMWRSAFEDYRLIEQWSRTGKKHPRTAITFARGAMVGLPARISGAEFFRDVSAAPRRLLFTVGVCPAMALALGGLAGGSGGAGLSVALILLAGLWQAARRLKLARMELPSRADWFRRHAWAHLATMPLAWWTGLAAWAASVAEGREGRAAAARGGEALQ